MKTLIEPGTFHPGSSTVTETQLIAWEMGNRTIAMDQSSDSSLVFDVQVVAKDQ